MQAFEENLSKITFEVFDSIFGAELSSTILKNIKDFSVNGIIEFFTETLPRILDSAGSMIIEDLVLETLYMKSGIELERKKSNTFRDYVITLEHKLEK
jgi:hypothetical protein